MLLETVDALLYDCEMPCLRRNTISHVKTFCMSRDNDETEIYHRK